MVIVRAVLRKVSQRDRAKRCHVVDALVVRLRRRRVAGTESRKVNEVDDEVTIDVRRLNLDRQARISANACTDRDALNHYAKATEIAATGRDISSNRRLAVSIRRSRRVDRAAAAAQGQL